MIKKMIFILMVLRQLQIKFKQMGQKVGYLLFLSLLSTVYSQAQECGCKVQAVGAGYRVDYSSYYVYNNNPRYNHHIGYRLDSQVSEYSYGGWAAASKKMGDWISVSSNEPKIWTDIITQGAAGQLPAWITKYSIESTMDGINWIKYKFGKIFAANIDRHGKVFNELNPPIRARSIRIVVQEYNWHPSCRFGVMFLDQQECE